MSDESGLQRTDEGGASSVAGPPGAAGAVEDGVTKLYRPAPDGGLEAVAPDGADYREKLGSRRWGAAPLENPEVEKTNPTIAVAFIIGLSIFTFVVIVVGYSSGFWGCPGPAITCRGTS